MPSPHYDNRPLNPEQEAAICWCADQQVALAIQHGVITESQGKEHWFTVAQDLIDDPALLDKMVDAHGRSKKNKRITSTKILNEHDNEGHSADRRDESAPIARTHNSHMLATLTAATLAFSAPLYQVFSQSVYAGQGSAMSGGGMPFKRQEPEIPLHERPRVVTEPTRRRNNKGEDEWER